MSIAKETLLHAYRTMRTIREFEERVNAEIMNGQIPGFTHLYTGQEANAVGVCAHLDESDTIISTHRGHGHCIAKGAETSISYLRASNLRISKVCVSEVCEDFARLVLPQRGIAVRGWAQGGPKDPMWLCVCVCVCLCVCVGQCREW